jgi:cytoskeleton protein RodZ
MLSSLIWVVAAILVCAGAYYLLAHLPSRRSAPDRVAVAPTPTAPVTKTPDPTPAPTPPPTSEIPAKGSETPTAQVPATASPAPGVPAAAPAAPADTTTTAAPIQLAISATAAVWVTAIADGQNVLGEVLQPGTNKIITATKGARLTLGNAGGVDITFNGKKLEPFGPSGQVRTVDFTSWGAQVVSRTPPNPDPLR